jgi:HSP20 family protein
MTKEIQMWAPFRELDQFRRNFDEMFDRVLGGWTPAETIPELMRPAVESFVENGKIVIRADLPGIDPKDIDVTISGDMLTIRGKRERSQEEKSRDYIRREVSYGSFERTVALPKGVDSEQIKAAYKNGVLELTVSAPKELSARKVPITIDLDKRKNT